MMHMKPNSKLIPSEKEVLGSTSNIEAISINNGKKKGK